MLLNKTIVLKFMATLRKYYKDIVVNNLKVTTIENALLETIVNGDMQINNITTPPHLATLTVTAADKLQVAPSGSSAVISATSDVVESDSTASTSATTGAVIVSGGVGVAQCVTTGSITFPAFNVNPGTPLSQYSVYTLATAWGGVWTTPKPFNLYIVAVGNALFYYAPYVSGQSQANSTAVSTVRIPVAYLPNTAFNFYTSGIVVTKGATTLQGFIQIVAATGIITVSIAPYGTKWAWTAGAPPTTELAGIRLMFTAVRAY